MIFGGEDTDADFHKIFGHNVKCGGLGILDPWSSADSAYNTSKAVCGELVGSLLGVTNLNYLGLRKYVRRTSAGAREEREDF